jgi:hypothetical protein
MRLILIWTVGSSMCYITRMRLIDNNKGVSFVIGSNVTGDNSNKVLDSVLLYEVMVMSHSLCSSCCV